MQPYFLPYVGYYQLISSVDMFVVYDNIQYTKKGWINRNRVLVNDKEAYITVPLQKASDFLDIGQRQLSPDYDRRALLNRIRGAYLKAPFFDPVMDLITDVVTSPESNLFDYIHQSIAKTASYVGLQRPIVRSSEIDADHSLRGQDRVISICRALGADRYVNASGGRSLYSSSDFESNGITLSFIEPAPFEYRQFGAAFVPWLSIVDVLMFNDLDTVREVVATGYYLT